MPLTYYDTQMLYQNGFTRSEVARIQQAAEEEGLKELNLENLYWAEALADHQRVMEAYLRLHPDANLDDYDLFIDNWHRTLARERDPWVWIDQFYYRKQAGAVTKARWEAAYKAVRDLKAQLFID